MRLMGPRLSRRGYVALTIAGIVLPTLLLGALGLYFVQRHFRFQEQILAEYSRFSVDYAASEIERAIFGEESDIAGYLQLAALVDEFQPAEELRRAELTYPILENAFARGLDGAVVFARWQPQPANAPAEGIRASERDLGGRERAARILQRVLVDETVHHVLLSGDVHYYTGVEDEIPYHLVVFPGSVSRERDRGVIGFFLDVNHLRDAVVGHVLERSIYTAKGRFAPDFGRVLTLVVRDDKDEAVYTHHRPGATHAEAKTACQKEDLARASLAGILPGWKVGITYAQAGGFGWSRRIVYLLIVLLLLAAAVVVIGTLVTMRFVLRQMELSRVKSHFVSNITHELKTPLAAIRLYTETLQQGRVHDQTEIGRFLGIIHKETGRLTSLINNILDFARIEDGRRRYKFTPARVGDVVQDVVDSYSYQLQHRGFDLQLEIEPGLPGDAPRSRCREPGRPQSARQRSEVLPRCEAGEHSGPVGRSLAAGPGVGAGGRGAIAGCQCQRGRRDPRRGAGSRHRNPARGAGSHLRGLLSRRKGSRARRQGFGSGAGRGAAHR